MYAAALIDRAMKETGASSQAAFAKTLGVAGPTVSQWRHGTSPVPEDRVMQLCALAGIEDVGPWLVAAQADAARSDAVRAALETVLDRLRPALAGVGLVMLAFAGFLLPYQAQAAADQANLNNRGSIHYAQLRRRVKSWFESMARRFGALHASPMLA